MGRIVLPPYIPPSLLIKQVSTLMTFKNITGWRGLGYWLKSANRLINVAAGAIGLGCFGYPIHPVFEITSNCNLRCMHCHANGGERLYRELDTDEAMKVIENLANVKDFRMLVFTGGEPLVRKDLFKLTRHAYNLGFRTVIATNATLIDREVSRKMRENGVEGVAVSIDFVDPAKHDSYRGVKGAFEKAIRGLDNVRREGLYVQINITLSRRNVDQLKQLLNLTDRLGAHVVLLYQLMPSGRGEELIDEILDQDGFLQVMDLLKESQETINPMVIPVGLPEYFAYLIHKNNLNLKLAPIVFKGCIAGRGMFYIKPNGDVWPCPFIPINAGNLLEKTSEEIWSGPIFNMLRDRENLKGVCGRCSYREVCGGCRARAYAYTGDLFSPDPLCPLNPKNRATFREGR